MSHLAVGDFRHWLLSDGVDDQTLAALAPGVTPEMAAAVCKIMRHQDLIGVAGKCRVVTAFMGTISLPGRLSTRPQPSHSNDEPAGIAASLPDGLFWGNGDAIIGINSASDHVPRGVSGVQLKHETLALHSSACCQSRNFLLWRD